MSVRVFGPYEIAVQGEHAVITRTDSAPAEPTWYELQHMARIAWGRVAGGVAVKKPWTRPCTVQHSLWNALTGCNECNGLPRYDCWISGPEW